MKNINLVLLLLIFGFACDSETANNCFQTSGEIIKQEVVVPNFSKILVNRGVELIISDSSEQSIIVETGRNLLNDVEVTVENDILILTDNNTCNFVRNYGITKVYVTSPNITNIRSSSQYAVSSQGILTYPSLRVISENFNAPETFAIGDFILEINNETLRVVCNGTSFCNISGFTTNLNINFPGGDSRFEGQNLQAQKVTIFNRSSNDMIVNPKEELMGTISNTGNVISFNRPPLVNVEELYRGRLIFE